MADYPKAIDVVMGQEGWGTYTNRSTDRGGPTKYGVTLVTLSKWRGRPCTAQDVMGLQLPEALQIYREHYWSVICGDGIQDQNVATKLLSNDVVEGPHEAVILAQRCLNDLGADLAVDGDMGTLTLGAVNGADPVQLVARLCRSQAAFFTSLNEPANLPGWLVRAAWPYRSMDQVPNL